MTAPPFPKRLLVALTFLVVGSYVISFGQSWELHDFQSMLLVVLTWYACCTLDVLMVVMQQPTSGWPRAVGCGLAGIQFCSFSATFLRAVELPIWIRGLMLLAIIPALVYGITGRYLLMKAGPPPPA